MRTLTDLATIPAALELIGTSPATERARRATARAAGCADPVLISAEIGLDVLAVARAIHDHSAQSSGTFVIVDCADHDGTELEQQIFTPRTSGGTLLVANLDGLPSQLQLRLARVLRDGHLDIDASGQGVPFDVRVLASISGDVEEDIRNEKIRRELSARFTLRLDLPPLRLRPADIPTLVGCLAVESASASGLPLPTFTREALTVLAALPWRRNFHELREVLDVLVAAARGGSVGLEDVLTHVPVERTSTRAPGAASLRQARMSFEREYIAAVLHRHGWRIDEASRTLGIQRTNLYRKLRQLGIARARQSR
jgi:DNA-binding NtrC family response regulator